MGMSRVTDCAKSGSAIRRFDFNGFVIEIISRRDRVANKPQAGQSICSICLNVINDDVVILKCQDSFCRRCIVQAIIDNEEDPMTCPSKYAKCDDEIAMQVIEEILGEENFKLYRINKLERRLDSLVALTESKK